MGIEIERKFLVADDGWRGDDPGIEFRQGYLAADRDRTVRVRLEGARGVLTVKGMRQGLTRREYEYTIPAADARELLELSLGTVIVKTRHKVPVGDHVWDVDEFAGANAPLVTAEVELAAEDEAFVRPPWLGREVSAEDRYANSRLCRRPYGRWTDAER